MKQKWIYRSTFLFLFAWGNLLLASDTKDVALLFKSTGKVEIYQENKKIWSTGSRGYRLNSGDKIRTGYDSFAAILFTDDKSLMKVRSGSDLLIQGERNESSIAKRIFMEVGEVFVSVKKQNTVFRLETPTGVAAVKGTEFYGLVDQEGNMSIIAIKGIIELINKYGSILLTAGETGKSDGKNPPLKDNTEGQPNWGAEQEPTPDELEIEFKSPNGDMKKLKIRTKTKGSQE